MLIDNNITTVVMTEEERDALYNSLDALVESRSIDMRDPSNEVLRRLFYGLA